MRIISGSLKGRVIHAPRNLPVRPTTDFAKTALFNILQHQFDFESVSVLDLFCGTGNISYEFASRGCKQLIAVDAHAACLRFVKETCSKLGITGLLSVKSDVFRFLENYSQQFDIIFADPPYEMDEVDRLPDIINDRQLLKPGGWLILEHQSKRTIKSVWLPTEVRVYSNCAFSIFKV